MRWNVERAQHDFEDVGAPHCEVGPGGALIFRDASLHIVVIYAPGQWLTVTPEQE